NTILAEQNARLDTTRPQLGQLRDLAGFAAQRLRDGDVDAIGPALRESWEAKRKLASGVSNGHIDAAVSRALEAGGPGDERARAAAASCWLSVRSSISVRCARAWLTCGSCR